MGVYLMQQITTYYFSTYKNIIYKELELPREKNVFCCLCVKRLADECCVTCIQKLLLIKFPTVIALLISSVILPNHYFFCLHLKIWFINH